jgi:hypothetical protein
VAGWLRHVCVSTETWSKTELPAHVREGLARFTGEPAQPARETA